MAIVWAAQDTETGKPVYLTLTSNGKIEQVQTEPVDTALTAKAVAAESGQTFALNGIDVYRDSGWIVLYTDDAVYENVNKWGADLLIERATMKVVDVRDREATGKGPFALDAKHLVLSGHHDAGRALLATFPVGAAVTLLDTLPEAPAEASGKPHCAVWVMCWSNSPKVDIASLPEWVDEIRLAFAVDNAKMVGYGPYGGKERLASLLRSFLAQREDRFISVSVGGGGYTISIPNAEEYAKRILAIGDDLAVPIGGINWDWEASAFRTNADKCIEVSRRLKALRGKDFWVSWSPNGQFKDDYRTVLRNALDVVDEISQQFYDGDETIDYAATDREVSLYVDLFGASKVGVGMMVGTEVDQWSVEVCQDYVTRLRAAYDIRITNLWEASRPGTTEWIAAMQTATA